MNNNQELNNVIDISMKGVGKKKIRINGDDNLILMLNTSDFNVMRRLEESLPKLESLEAEITKLGELSKENVGSTADIAAQIKSFDDQMKEIVDHIFDSNVSEVCAGNASMCDIVDGGFLCYEVIISALTALYGDTIDKQTKAMQNRVKAHTTKYTKKKR